MIALRRRTYVYNSGALYLLIKKISPMADFPLGLIRQPIDIFFDLFSQRQLFRVSSYENGYVYWPQR